MRANLSALLRTFIENGETRKQMKILQLHKLSKTVLMELMPMRDECINGIHLFSLNHSIAETIQKSLDNATTRAGV